MPIYSNMPEDFRPRPSDMNVPLRSTLGVGPRGPQGHGVTAEVIDTDPYGYFRIQFKDAETNEVLAVTPNLDVGSRLYACDKVFDVAKGDTCTANVTDFTTMQASNDRSAVRVGDLVLFGNSTSDERFLALDTFGIGIVTTVTNNVVTFVVHDVVTAGLRDGAITTNMLADLCVTTEKLANSAVVTAKIANSAVTTGKIEDAAVTARKIADGAVSTNKIADGAVTTGKIPDNAITTAKVTNGAVTEQKLANGAVTSDKIADESVQTRHIDDYSVTGDKIAANAVSSSKIRDKSITFGKLADDIAFDVIAPKMADPIGWDPSREYDSLTIVTHNGDSYTSRADVPIGIDIDDNRYWAQTGNYNAQVEEYRQEVRDFDNEYITYVFANIMEYDTMGCCLGMYKDKSFMIDVGSNSIHAELMDMLDDNSVSSLDFVFITHYHSDHVGEIDELIGSGHIGASTTVVLPPDGEYLTRLDVAGGRDTIVAELTAAGSTIVFAYDNYVCPIDDNVKVRSINADAGFYDENSYSLNECSVNYIVEFKESSIAYFPGDLYPHVLYRLYERGLISRRANLYNIGHHGFETQVNQTTKESQDAFNAMTFMHPDIAYVSQSAKRDRRLYGSFEYHALSEMNVPIMSNVDFDGRVSFRQYKESVVCTNGYPANINSVGCIQENHDYFADGSLTEFVRPAGTSADPFTSIEQAISMIPIANGTRSAVLNLKPNTYSPPAAYYNLILEDPIGRLMGTSADDTLLEGYKILSRLEGPIGPTSVASTPTFRNITFKDCTLILKSNTLFRSCKFVNTTVLAVHYNVYMNAVDIDDDSEIIIYDGEIHIDGTSVLNGKIVGGYTAGKICALSGSTFDATKVHHFGSAADMRSPAPLSNADLNDARFNGFAFIETATASNYPTEIQDDYFMLQSVPLAPVPQIDRAIYFQTVTDMSGNTYRRTYNVTPNQWSSWS